MSLSFRFCIVLSPFLALFLSHFFFTDSYCTDNILKPNHHITNKPQINTSGQEPCRAHSSRVHTTSQNRKWKHLAGNTCIVLLGLNKPQNLSKQCKRQREVHYFLNGPRLTACHTWLCAPALQRQYICTVFHCTVQLRDTKGERETCHAERSEKDKKE